MLLWKRQNYGDRSVGAGGMDEQAAHRGLFRAVMIPYMSNPKKGETVQSGRMYNTKSET